MHLSHMKLRYQEYIIIDCVSFTTVALILSISDAIGWSSGMGCIFLLQLFGCCTLICLLMWLTDHWEKQRHIVDMLVRLADVAVVILGVGGGIFHWFPWTMHGVIPVCVTFTVVFLVTYVIMLIQDKFVTQAINEYLKKKKG